MEVINIKGSYDTPGVVLDPQSGTFEIVGRSYPEDTAEFYIPILGWMDHYADNPNQKTNFRFQLDYFNSSSYKPFLDILLKLENIKNKGSEVQVEWCYKEGDWDIKEAGENFSEIAHIPFKFTTYK